MERQLSMRVYDEVEKRHLRDVEYDIVYSSGIKTTMSRINIFNSEYKYTSYTLNDNSRFIAQMGTYHNDIFGNEIFQGDKLKPVKNSLGNLLKEPVVTFNGMCFQIICPVTNHYEYLHYYETDSEIEIIKN